MPQREHQNIQGYSGPDSGSVITSFDELTKGLGTGAVSRRQALRWLGGALVGAALASVPGVAWADDDRCSEGLTRCGDRCVNLQTNERHCGSCSNRCASNQTCCKGRCVNLQRNERHCGGCFSRCPEGEECVGGVCQCPSGTTLCGGACMSNVCPQGQVFNTSTCQCECPSGTTLCGGNCVANCPSGQTLNTSTCKCVQVCPPSCPPGQACVDGQCAVCTLDQWQSCCTCFYDFGPGNPVVSTCSGTVFGPDSSTCEYNCQQSCLDNAPPGTQSVGSSRTCFRPQDRILQLCIPNTREGETGIRCSGNDFTCTPAG